MKVLELVLYHIDYQHITFQQQNKLSHVVPKRTSYKTVYLRVMKIVPPGGFVTDSEPTSGDWQSQNLLERLCCAAKSVNAAASSPDIVRDVELDVIAVFEVDENGVETHLIEFLRFEHPLIVIIGIDSLVVDLFRIAIGDQPLVGAERDGNCPAQVALTEPETSTNSA